MLVAHDLEASDKVSPFIGAIVDLICRNEHSSEVTNVDTKYIELLMFVCREKNMQMGWNIISFSVLETKVLNSMR